MITIEDYVYFHDQHCPTWEEHGECECWRPRKDEDEQMRGDGVDHHQ